MANKLPERKVADILLQENASITKWTEDVSDEEIDVVEEQSDQSDLGNSSGNEDLGVHTGNLQSQSDNEHPGPTNGAEDCNTIEEFWSILFNECIINVIVTHTNHKIEEHRADLIARGINVQSYHHQTEACEIKAYIGLLYYSGLWKTSNVDDNVLWSKKQGITFYRCVMSLNRFRFLSKSIRFDQKSNRDENDKFAPIREIWDIFIKNCMTYYNPHKFCTVDEQLLGFRGRCPFRVFIKSKPVKYGLKIVTLNDATTSYLIYGIPYIRKENFVGSLEIIPQKIFTDVTIPIHGSNRTITCGSWFTSIMLIEMMMDAPYNLTITGTLKKNKKEIPKEMKIASQSPPDTKFCFSKTKRISLLSYTPKQREIVLVASSYSTSTRIVDGIPEIILHYNATKDGTNCFDQLCRAHTVSRKTNRWTMRFFYGMLDQAIVNARILLKCKLINVNKDRPLPATECLETIYRYLIVPYLQIRQTCPSLRFDIKIGISGILDSDKELAQPSNRTYLKKRKRCTLCKATTDRKTREVCMACDQPMCDKHRAFYCINCAGCD
ncbi:hypothetical protein ABEB36_003135 [Hypothenemus hampei]|uniref:PiggyBac transposable element-derived protein domain-containing protein n=1 Tax=Hypothenemus hampei TaxID=57062 RepID=A0ABD1FA00_HYPHA